MTTTLTLVESADAQLVDLWLHGRSPHTQRAYRAGVARFRARGEKPLVQVTLGDLQAFADGLAQLAPTSQARILSAVKSLFAFGRRLGLLMVDAGVVDRPIFRSRKKDGHLDPAQVREIVGAAARRVGTVANVSPHWLRHAHASHALDRGCPIRLVQATLGHASAATTGRYLHARPTDSLARYLAV